jgi:putative ABC transport system substrate-binding protein
MPTIGFLRSTPSAPFAHLLTAFRAGLNETGFVEGTNVTIEQRYADNHYERLPALAAELLRHPVAVIVANGVAAKAARAASASLPIVFVSADDPVRVGLVTSLNRPGGNSTGVTFFGGAQLDAKRLELLRDLVPSAAVLAALVDPACPGSAGAAPNAVAAGHAIGRQVWVVKAASERELDPAFAAIVEAGAGALMVSGSPFFTSQRQRIVTLAARHRIPAIYDQRDFVAAGGLISYSGSFTGAYREAGIYAGRILKGAVPGEMPVQQPTTFDLVINLKTAAALQLDVPPSMLLRASDVLR